MISYLKRLSKSSNIISRCQFSFSLSEERVEYYKAVLACKVIKLVMNSRMLGTSKSDDGSYPSLRSLCVNEINNYKPVVNIKPDTKKNQEQAQNSIADAKAKVDENGESNAEPKDDSKRDSEVEEARKFMLTYFIGGVWLHNNYCPQNRFGTDLKSKSSIISSGEPLQDYLEFPGKEKFKKVVFCPTHMITIQQFRKLKSSKSKFLLYGQPGIGKSYSFILYLSLSEIIFRYRQKYSNKLTQSSEIDFKNPKMIYISLGPKSQENQKTLETFDEKEFNRIILSQCFLESESFNEKDFQNDFFETLRKQVVKYQDMNNDNDIVVVVDQINTMASLQRQIDQIDAKLKTIQSQIKGLGESDKKKQQKLQLTKKHKQLQSQKKVLKQLFDQYYTLILKLRKSKAKLIYLSSIDIEQNLLPKLNLIGDSNHFYIEKISVKYEKFYKNKSIISDNIQLIITIFEAKVINLKKFLPQKKEYSHKLTDQEIESLDQIKLKLKQRFKQQYIPTTLFSIGKAFNEKLEKYLSEQEMQDIISELNNETNLVKFAIEKFECQNAEDLVKVLINSIQNENRNMLIGKIKEFINNEPQSGKIQLKSGLLLKLLYEAKLKRIEQQKNSSSDSESLLSVKINLQNNRSPKKYDPYLTNKLFSYDEDKKSYFLNVPVQMLVSISDELQDELIDNLSGNIQDIFELFDAPSMKGLMIESMLRRVLAVEHTFFQYYSNVKKAYIPFNIKKNQNRMNYFEPIPTISEKKYLTYDFLNSFYQQMSKAETTQNKVGIFQEPGKKVKNENNKSEQTYNFVFNSKQIDFILCQKARKDFNIFAYDLTITVTQTQITKKVMSFFFDYSNFKENFFNDESASKILYQLELSYNVIVPTLEKLEIDWQKVFEAEIKRLQNEIKGRIKNNKQSQSATSIKKNNEPGKKIDVSTKNQKQAIIETIREINQQQRFFNIQKILLDEENKKLEKPQNKQSKRKAKEIKNLINSLKEKEADFKKYTNAYLLLTKLQIAQIPGTNSFTIDQSESGSGSFSAPTSNKITFKGVEIISLVKGIQIYNQKTEQKRIKTYLNLLQMFKKQALGKNIQ